MFDSIQYFTQMLAMNGHLPAELNFRENTAKSSVIPSSNMLAISFYHQVNSAGLKSYLFSFCHLTFALVCNLLKMVSGHL